MKQIIALLIIFSALSVQSQITLSHTHTGEKFLTKLTYHGYKYYGKNNATETIDVLNTDNTMFKSIAVPFYSVATLDYLYLSDNLFDTDSLIEFLIYRPVGNTIRLEIYNELGTLLFGRTGVMFVNTINGSGQFDISVLRNDKILFYDGTSAKMRLRVNNMNNFEVYDLPGAIPCEDCYKAEEPEEDLTNIKVTPEKGRAVFYPNPVRDQLKLKFELPRSAKKARIKIFDNKGALVKDVEVSTTTDFIFLPSEFNNGLYLYALEIDGEVVKSEKIILDK